VARHQVLLVPDAWRDLERLPAALQDAVLDALERDLDPASPSAEPLEVDGRRYYRMPLGHVEALFRPLDPDEVQDRVARGFIEDEPGPVFRVFGIDRAQPEARS
jgi:hypothetical protein